MVLLNSIKMQNKKVVLWTIALVAMLTSSLFMTSCKKKFDEPPVFLEPDITVTHTIAEIKALHVSGAVESFTTPDMIISGVVNADDESGNYYKQISIQDATGGITIRLDGTNLYANYPVGRKIYIKLNGLFMGDYNGLIQIGGSADYSGTFPNVKGIASNLFDTYIVKGSIGYPVPAKVVKISELDNSLQSMLIQIDSSEFQTADINKTYADGITNASVNLTVKPCSGGSIIVRTSGYSTFATINVPDGNGPLRAIYTTFGSTKQLIIRDTSDVQFYSATRCGGITPPPPGPTTRISIAALRAMYTGTDITLGAYKIGGVVIATDAEKNMSTGNVILQDGNSGIAVYFGGSAVLTYAVGDSVVVDVTGAGLKKFSGSLEVDAFGMTPPAKTAGGSPITPVTKTLAQINTALALPLGDPNNIEFTLVKVVSVTTPGGTYEGSKAISDASGGITLYTQPGTSGATFRLSSLPGTCVDLTGYPLNHTSGNEIKIRNTSDVTTGTGCSVAPPSGGLALTTSPYIQNFDAIGTALPSGVSVRTAANASALGTIATFTSSNATGIWTKTGGGFKNFASATGLTSSTDSATQANATNRALGLRQVSATDKEVAFVFQLDNTTGKTNLALEFLLQSLDVTSTRTVTWSVDYGLGDAPTTFTTVTPVGTMTTGGVFTNNTITASFGSALDNKSGKVWIRIVALGASTGTGNRPSTAVDNFKLTWN